MTAAHPLGRCRRRRRSSHHPHSASKGVTTALFWRWGGVANGSDDVARPRVAYAHAVHSHVRLATAILAVALATGCSIGHASQKDEFNTWLSNGATPYLAGINSAEIQMVIAQESDDPGAILSACQQFAGAVSAAAKYGVTSPPPDDIVPTWHDAMTHIGNAVSACFTGDHIARLSETMASENDIVKVTGGKPPF